MPWWGDLGRSRVTGYALAGALPLFVIALTVPTAAPAFVFEHLMVLIVVAVTIAAGLGPGVVAAVVGTIGDNLLLREPVGRPAITGTRDVIDLALFLVVAVVVGWLVHRLEAARSRAMELAQQERRAREGRDRLIATITHDLATPLNAIMGTIQFARKRAGAAEVDVARLMQRVETAAVRATWLLRILADTRSIERQSLSLNAQPVDAREVVEPIVQMLDRISDRHPIIFAADPGPLMIHADPDRLGSVVENLISNAIKYSPGGGAVEVCVGREGEWVTISVRDHGIGIPASAAAHLFEAGYRSEDAARVAPGLGLGLYIASEVVRRHAGTIAPTAADGGGTLFTVRLPLLPGAPPGGQRPRADRSANEPGARTPVTSS